MTWALLSGIWPKVHNHEQQYIIRHLVFTPPCFIMWGLQFVAQWAISFFHFSAQIWLRSSLFLSSLSAFWSWLYSCQPVLISGPVTIAGSWLQQGHQLVIPNTSSSAPWFSLSRTVFLSWLFQSCVVPTFALYYVHSHPKIPLPHFLFFLILQQTVVSFPFVFFLLFLSENLFQISGNLAR